MYPDPRVAALVTQHFEPVRVHARKQQEEYKRLGARLGAHWTPTILIVDPGGTERHRIEGFLPVDEFLPQLQLGLAKSAFAGGRFEEAERRYRAVLERHPDSESAPEALYWAGVARYKATHDAGALKDIARAFQDRYAGSTWAKKSAVWRE